MTEKLIAIPIPARTASQDPPTPQGVTTIGVRKIALKEKF